MPLKIDFWSDVDGSWEGKWSQVGTKMGLKIDLILNKVKTENDYKTNEISMNFGVWGVQVGSENRPKIDQTLKS